MEVLKYSRINKNGRLVEFTYSKCDQELIDSHIWYINNNGYVVTNINIDNRRTTLLLSRLLISPDSNLYVDHIDGDRSNNTRENLRVVTKHQNNMNQGIYFNNKSGVSGVSWYKRYRKWRVNIRINGKLKTVGYYADKNDAINVRKEMEKKYYGEYRRN